MGSHNLREITGVVNLPVSDSLKIRLGARRTKRDGLVNNISGPDMATQDRTVARASVLFEPTDWLSNYTVAIYSHRDERPAALLSGSDGAIAPCPINVTSCLYAIGKASCRERVCQYV